MRFGWFGESIGGCWTVRTGPCSTRNTALGNADGSGSDSLSRHIYLDAGASVSDAWVGTHADACNLTGRYIFAGWTVEKEKGRRYNRMRRKGEVGGRGSKSRQREITSMPIRAIHISWNTRLLLVERGPFSFNALRPIRYPPLLPFSSLLNQIRCFCTISIVSKYLAMFNSSCSIRLF